MRKVQHVHLVGIGGVGMSGIAEVLVNLGYRVSGSDLADGETVRRLRALGADVRVGHDATHLGDADVVVFSSAVREGNPEVAAARARDIPVIPRAEMLAELMRMKYGVAVAGSHGKTTTTSMIAHLLAAGGLDPTVVIGGKVNSLGAGARLGRGDLLVAEADESDGSFVTLTPTIAVVTGVDREHLDHYGSFDALRRTFRAFVRKVPFYGLAVLCADHPVAARLAARLGRRHASYGLSAHADVSAQDVRPDGLGSRFTLVRRGERVADACVRMPGAHNVQNALAALAVAAELDVPDAVAIDALAGFEGVQRRFTVRGEARGVLVVDDYGHHPAEIATTLAAARDVIAQRGRSGRLLVAFQPHRYTRTRDLLGDFAVALSAADALRITAVYAAGEDPIPGVDARHLCDALRARGHADVEYLPRRGDLAPALAAIAREGDLALALGAGDIVKTAPELLEMLQAHGP